MPGQLPRVRFLLSRFGSMLDKMLIWLQYLFDRISGPRGRAEELRAVRLRLADQDGRGVASREEVRLSLRLRGLRVLLVGCLGKVDACTRCVRPRSEAWPGGHCCSGHTEDLFTEAELSALKLSGTTSLLLRAPRSGSAGCVFRGPSGCSLAPAHRPSLCVRYMCCDLQRELALRPDGVETNRLQEEIRVTMEAFENRREERSSRRP